MHYIESSNMGVDENGNPCFVDGPPGTKINSSIMNALIREITNVIVQSGLTVLTKGTDTYTQLWDALQVLGRPYDLIVTSQIVFNSMLERVGANHYQIKSQYKSIFVKNITGGYNCTTWLSDGDTWGYIDTNNCAQLEFEAGAYIATGSVLFYLSNTTDYSIWDNVWIKGDGTSLVARTKSIHHYSYYATYNNCKVTDQLSSAAFNAFDWSDAYVADSLMVKTSQLNNCLVANIDITGNIFTGFYYCYKLTNCLTKNLINSAVIANDVMSFRNCNIINNCLACDINSVNAIATGFYDCDNLSSCVAENITSTNLNIATGFYNCNNISACEAINCLFGFTNCHQLSACNAKEFTSSVAATYTVYGFYTCYQLSACNAKEFDGDGDCYGFADCHQLSACYVDDFTSTGNNIGYHLCDYISSSNTTITQNTNNDYVDTDDASVTNKYSTPVNADGKWT